MHARTIFLVALWLGIFSINVVGQMTLMAEEPRGPFIPSPIRNAADVMWKMPPQVPHVIVRGPQMRRQTETPGRVNDPLHDHGRQTVDGAVVDPVWRQPYSYGYFGAVPNRHWKRHYGYHGGYVQWTLK